MTDPVVQNIEAAAAPSLIVALQAAQTMITTIMTGDPMTAGVRAGPAFQVFMGTLGLQLPGLAAAELGAVGQAAVSQLGNAITKLQALKAA